MSTSDPLGVFGPQIRVERHLRTWGHLPDRECGDVGEFGDNCEMPGAERIDNPEPSRIQYQPTSPLAENRREILRQKSASPYIGTRGARRERFKTVEKSRESREAIRKRRKQERKNRRKR